MYLIAINSAFREHPIRQCKTQSAGNGASFPRAATPQWRIECSPYGPSAKRPSTVLRPLEVEWLPLRRRALCLTTLRLAECTINSNEVHQ